jgi:hypothetical protein
MRMEFPKPTVDIKEVKERYHRSEKEEEAKIGKKQRIRTRKMEKNEFRIVIE